MIRNKKCEIITDGKIGTLNQCIGLADNLVSSYKTTTISLKKIWDLINPYVRIDSINPAKEEIKAPYPDILIVSGRKSISVGLHIKKKNPKTVLIAIQDPHVARNKFDYIILPEHDTYRGANVITTIGAMHKWNNKLIKSEGKKLKGLFKDLKQKKTIAVLLGGNSRNHKMDLELTKKVCENIKKAKQKLKANVVLTASRRTPPECFEYIQKTLGKLKNVYIYDGKGTNPLFAFIDIADYIFVSNDSISMLTEATFTGKPVYLIELEGGSAKFDRFHNGLKEKGIVKVLGKDALTNYKYDRIENAKVVAQKIEKDIKNDS